MFVMPKAFRDQHLVGTIELGSSSILVLHGTCNPLLCHNSSRSATKPIGSDCRQRARLSYTALTATYRANNCYILTKTSRNVIKLGPLPATQPDSAANGPNPAASTKTLDTFWPFSGQLQGEWLSDPQHQLLHLAAASL